ncbi:YrbL family protein [Persicirhabdus sediminis]|uniref:PhoP regulatory network protein YrbL n=1 Tax=Persicirhabdus sediminis TaxID=454144 RepID=A0A8J7SMN7_9BACT|nr:YrbL family protein [Persicirhabdus sediminis]MBK1792190.1 hypothetical protein [Persicirhabdus sediminis]
MNHPTLQLTQQHYISEGRDRVCYLHPEDENRCIKITKTGCDRILKRINREIRYFEKYQRKGRYYPFLSAYYGPVETSMGEGHMFEIVRSYDGSVARTLQSYWCEKRELLDEAGEAELRDEISTKVMEIYQLCCANKIPLSDLNGENLLMVYENETDYSLKLIDGFGNAHFIKVMDWFQKTSSYKLTKQFNKMFDCLIGRPLVAR